jgi:hypothetical protein
MDRSASPTQFGVSGPARKRARLLAYLLLGILAILVLAVFAMTVARPGGEGNREGGEGRPGQVE